MLTRRSFLKSLLAGAAAAVVGVFALPKITAPEPAVAPLDPRRPQLAPLDPRRPQLVPVKQPLYDTETLDARAYNFQISNTSFFSMAADDIPCGRQSKSVAPWKSERRNWRRA